jgi:putative colanic acid biosynthesis glycosyltransferase WcaI
MRFAILSQWYDPEPGSAAVSGVLARGLRERGHSVQVVTGFPNYPDGRLAPGYRLQPRLDEKTAEGIRIRRVPLYPSHDRSPWRRVANYSSFALSAAASAVPTLRRSDAIWVYNSPATVGLPSCLASAAGGPPHLMHVVDLWPDSVSYSGMASAGYDRVEPLVERWCRFTYRRAAGVAAISQGLCAELVARGVPPAKVRYIPVWIDEERHRPRPRDPALAAELDVADDFVLLYAGNLGEAQGLDQLLEICARLRDLPRFRCLIAGTGIAEKRLRERAASLRLDNVTFLGRWPATDIGRLMSIGDVHLVSLADHPLSSLTFPSKLTATLASGRAVVVVASGEAARVVVEAQAGWAVAPGDAIGLESALRTSHSLGRQGNGRIGINARRYYDRELSTSRSIDAVEASLIELVEQRSTWAAAA